MYNYTHPNVLDAHGREEGERRYSGWRQAQEQLEVWRETTESVGLDADLFRKVVDFNSRGKDPIELTVRNMPHCNRMLGDFAKRYASHCKEHGTNLHDLLEVTLLASHWHPETLQGAVQWWKAACEGPYTWSGGSPEARQWFTDHEHELLEAIDSPLVEIIYQKVFYDKAFGTRRQSLEQGYGEMAILGDDEDRKKALQWLGDDVEDIIAPLSPSEDARQKLRALCKELFDTYLDDSYHSCEITAALYDRAQELLERSKEGYCRFLTADACRKEAAWLKKVREVTSDELWEPKWEALLRQRLSLLETMEAFAAPLDEAREQARDQSLGFEEHPYPQTLFNMKDDDPRRPYAEQYEKNWSNTLLGQKVRTLLSLVQDARKHGEVNYAEYAQERLGAMILAESDMPNIIESLQNGYNRDIDDVAAMLEVVLPEVDVRAFSSEEVRMRIEQLRTASRAALQRLGKESYHKMSNVELLMQVTYERLKQAYESGEIDTSAQDIMKQIAGCLYTSTGTHDGIDNSVDAFIAAVQLAGDLPPAPVELTHDHVKRGFQKAPQRF